MWVARYSENHFLDCEAMAAAAAWRIGSDRQKAAKKEINSSNTRRIDPPDYEAAPRTEPTMKTIVAPVVQKAIRARFANFANRLNR